MKFNYVKIFTIYRRMNISENKSQKWVLIEPHLLQKSMHEHLQIRLCYKMNGEVTNFCNRNKNQSRLTFFFILIRSLINKRLYLDLLIIFVIMSCSSRFLRMMTYFSNTELLINMCLTKHLKS